jgi:membrane-bound serine protease (ClpP class)
MGRGKRGLFILLILKVCLLSIIFLISSQVYSQEAGGKVFVVDMEMTIDYGASDLLDRVVSVSVGDVRAIIIRLNTNGGYLQPTEKIVDSIMRSPVKVIVYIPPGGRALSAGAYIAISADVLVMSPGSVIGSAEPRTISGETDAKVVNAMAGWIASLAKFRERNETAAKLMVFENYDYIAEEAVKINIADYIVVSFSKILEKEGLVDAEIVEYSPDLRSKILSILSDPFVVGIIIDIAALLILIEIFHPTFFGAIGAAIGFSLALLGLGLIGADALAVIVLLLGIISILMEIKIGHGGPAIIGSILIALGVVLLYRREYFIWTFNYTSMVVGGLILIVVVSGIIGLYLHKIREVIMKKKSMLDPDIIVGKEGVVKSRITPSSPGVVLVMSDLWTAYADEEISEGEKIKVVRVDGLRLYVKKID